MVWEQCMAEEAEKFLSDEREELGAMAQEEIRDRSELASLMLEWERAQRRADELRATIEGAVVQIGETVEVGNVRATYSNPRKRYDYEAVGADAPETLVQQYTSTVTKTDWRKLVLDGMGIGQDLVPYSQGSPSVNLKML
jgi:hypothetical protein